MGGRHKYQTASHGLEKYFRQPLLNSIDKMKRVSWGRLYAKCGMPKAEFASLKKAIDKHLEHPDSHAARRERGGEVWDDWLDSFIDGGVGVRFWGPGTRRKWSFPENRAEIREFLYRAAWHSAKFVECRLDLGLIGRPAKNLETQKHVVVPPPVRKLAGRPRKQLNYVKPQNETPLQELKGGQSTPTIERPNARPRGAPIILDIDSEDESSVSTTEPPESREPLAFGQQNFILETNKFGSTEVIPIYGVDVPTLAHLIEKICVEHGLEEYQILVIKVKMGDRLFNLGLDDRRDWEHISRIIARNGSRAELVFWIRTQ